MTDLSNKKWFKGLAVFTMALAFSGITMMNAFAYDGGNNNHGGPYQYQDNRRDHRDHRDIGYRDHRISERPEWHRDRGRESNNIGELVALAVIIGVAASR